MNILDFASNSEPAMATLTQPTQRRGKSVHAVSEYDALPVGISSGSSNSSVNGDLSLRPAETRLGADYLQDKDFDKNGPSEDVYGYPSSKVRCAAQQILISMDLNKESPLVSSGTSRRRWPLRFKSQ